MVRALLVALALTAAGGCSSLRFWKTCPPPEPRDLATPELAWETFRKAFVEEQAWRAYCCFCRATQENVDYFDFSFGMKKEKYQKMFREVIILEWQRVKPERVELVTNYKIVKKGGEEFDRFALVLEDQQWKIEVPEALFEED